MPFKDPLHALFCPATSQGQSILCMVIHHESSSMVVHNHPIDEPPVTVRWCRGSACGNKRRARTLLGSARLLAAFDGLASLCER